MGRQTRNTGGFPITECVSPKKVSTCHLCFNNDSSHLGLKVTLGVIFYQLCLPTIAQWLRTSQPSSVPSSMTWSCITWADYLTFICKMGVIITLTLGDQHDGGDNLMHINYFEQHLTLTKYWMRVSCCLCWGRQSPWQSHSPWWSRGPLSVKTLMFVDWHMDLRCLWFLFSFFVCSVLTKGLNIQ